MIQKNTSWYTNLTHKYVEDLEINRKYCIHHAELTGTNQGKRIRVNCCDFYFYLPDYWLKTIVDKEFIVEAINSAETPVYIAYTGPNKNNQHDFILPD